MEPEIIFIFYFFSHRQLKLLCKAKSDFQVSLRSGTLKHPSIMFLFFGFFFFPPTVSFQLLKYIFLGSKHKFFGYFTTKDLSFFLKIFILIQVDLKCFSPSKSVSIFNSVAGPSLRLSLSDPFNPVTLRNTFSSSLSLLVIIQTCQTTVNFDFTYIIETPFASLFCKICSFLDLRRLMSFSMAHLHLRMNTLTF